MGRVNDNYQSMILVNFLFRILRLPSGALRRLRMAYIRRKLHYLGRGSHLYPGVYISNPENITIGEDVSIAPGVRLSASSKGSILIGDRCAIAAGTRFVTATHDYNVLPISSVGINRSIVVGKDVWIGTAAVILPGVTISDGVVVAAGAVVTKDIPANSVVGGVPAKEIRLLEPREKRFQRGAASKSGGEINNT
jgi:maltose O-acetyltransferase